MTKPKTAIEESIEETKEQLKAAQEREAKILEENPNATPEELVAKPEDKAPDPEPEKKPEEEKPKEESKPEGEVEAEAPKSPAQVRLAKKAERQRLEEELALERADKARLVARVAELERPRVEEKPEETPPDRAEDPAGYAEFVARKAEKTASVALEKLEKIEKNQNQQAYERSQEELTEAAKNELFQMENNLKKTLPDYDDVKNFYVNSLAFSIKKLNRNITDQQLIKAIDTKIFNDALALHKEGYENPVHALYEQIKADGYVAPSKAAEKEEKLKPNIDQVAKNRARNAGTVAAAAGTGQGEVTARYAATEMTTEEIGKLFATMTPQEKKNFYQQAR